MQGVSAMAHMVAASGAPLASPLQIHFKAELMISTWCAAETRWGGWACSWVPTSA